jgi:hypothetical protein
VNRRILSIINEFNTRHYAAAGAQHIGRTLTAGMHHHRHRLVTMLNYFLQMPYTLQI